MLVTAVRFLEFIAMDPVARSLATAPVDDEPLTEEDEKLSTAPKHGFKEMAAKAFRIKKCLPSSA